VDETYDREYSSDGLSRYGAYLRQKRTMFDHGDGPTNDPVAFALAAWCVAQAPIMAPGYVQSHPRVLVADQHWDDDGRAAVLVQLAAPLPEPVARSIDRWRGWERQGHDPSFWAVPYDNDYPAAYATVTLRIPLDRAALPVPRYRTGAPHTATAKQAVHALCGLLNDQVVPLLAALGDTG